MLQQNSFFSQALIFFGPHIEIEEEPFDENELDTSFFQMYTEFGNQEERNTGLIIAWF